MKEEKIKSEAPSVGGGDDPPKRACGTTMLPIKQQELEKDLPLT